MATVTYQTDQGPKSVTFSGTPTPQDIDEVAQKQGWKPAASSPNTGASMLTPASPSTPDSVINNADFQKYGILPKAAQFLGISKFGQGLATAGLETTGQGNQGLDSEAAAAKQLSDIMQKYPPGSPERKAAIAKYQQLYAGGVPSQTEIDPGTQLSDKEVLGSAGNVALDAMSGGSLTSGAEFGGTVATKTPGLMDALNTGVQTINKVVAPLDEATTAGRVGNAAIKGAEFGAAQGVTQGMNDNKSAADIATQAGEFMEGPNWPNISRAPPSARRSITGQSAWTKRRHWPTARPPRA